MKDYSDDDESFTLWDIFKLSMVIILIVCIGFIAVSFMFKVMEWIYSL